MASSPISSCQTEEGKVETVPDFIFLGSKITADGDYSHEVKKCLVLPPFFFFCTRRFVDIVKWHQQAWLILTSVTESLKVFLPVEV